MRVENGGKDKKRESEEKNFGVGVEKGVNGLNLPV